MFVEMLFPVFAVVVMRSQSRKNARGSARIQQLVALNK